MRQLILKMSISVAAFVSGVNGESDLIFSSMDEGSGEWTLQTLRETGLHIIGPQTFRDLSAPWPLPPDI